MGEITSTGEHESLADFFDSVAHTLKTIAAGDHPVCSVSAGRLVWM
ncbi:hypothetical protein ACFYY2_09390 [Streptomyces sp. NPDC001822]